MANFRAQGVMSRALQHGRDTPQYRSFPPLNLHRARVHRNHERQRPNGFTGRAQKSLPPFTLYRERASGKALAFTRTYERRPIRQCSLEGTAAKIGYLPPSSNPLNASSSITWGQDSNDSLPAITGTTEVLALLFFESKRISAL
jgi:hypothetical protein